MGLKLPAFGRYFSSRRPLETLLTPTFEEDAQMWYPHSLADSRSGVGERHPSGELSQSSILRTTRLSTQPSGEETAASLSEAIRDCEHH